MADPMRLKFETKAVLSIIGGVLVAASVYYAIDGRVTANATAIGTNLRSVQDDIGYVRDDIRELKESQDEMLETINDISAQVTAISSVFEKFDIKVEISD